MMPEQLAARLSTKPSEDNFVERKPQSVKAHELRQTLVAFSNTLEERQTAVLFIGVDDNGITLRPAFPFWPVFARMHVPWDAVVRIERKERMFFDVLELHCGREQESIVGILPSGAANAIAARWPVKNVPDG